MRYLLDRLGMSSKYKGYRMLLLALEIALRDEDNLTNIFQRIYTPVAERCGVTPVMVDKNLRSIIDNLRLSADALSDERRISGSSCRLYAAQRHHAFTACVAALRRFPQYRREWQGLPVHHTAFLTD